MLQRRHSRRKQSAEFPFYSGFPTKGCSLIDERIIQGFRSHTDIFHFIFPKNRKFDRTERIAGTSRIRLLSKERDEPSPEPEYSLSGQTALRQLFRNSGRLEDVDALLLHLLDFGYPQTQGRVNRLALQSLSREECQGRPDEHRKC